MLQLSCVRIWFSLLGSSYIYISLAPYDKVVYLLFFRDQWLSMIVIYCLCHSFRRYFTCFICMAGSASQAGDAESSRAPGLTSGLQGSVNVLRSALLLVPQWQCISSFVFYILYFTFEADISILLSEIDYITSAYSVVTVVFSEQVQCTTKVQPLYIVNTCLIFYYGVSIHWGW